MTQKQESEVRVLYDVPATMRDGVVLRANVYLPASKGHWPVLLLRIPYGKHLPLATSLFDPAQMVRKGYVVIIQDTRGRYASEGEWEPNVNEWLDGVDTIEWAASLPYSDGQISMFGASYSGFAQWAPAILRPAALKAIVPMITVGDPLNGSRYRAGAFELGKHTNWHLQLVGTDVILKQHQGQADPRKLGQALRELAEEIDALGTRGYWSLPLKEFAPLKRTGTGQALFEELEHVMDREGLDGLTLAGKYEQVQVPALNIGGWYDVYLQGTIESFRAMHERGSTRAARQSQLLIGPWSHMNRTNLVGEINFGIGANSAALDLKSSMESVHQRWFDRWLKGLENGVTEEAPIKLFVMGANVWREENEWPLARAVETRYYLHSGGRANTLHGDGMLSTIPPREEAADTYDYDPAHPVITRGGALLMTAEYPAGPYDQRTTESREDVLVYTTPPLKEDTEVTGPITVVLWATSSAPDTDFVVRLIDVHPDGYARNLTDGIIRARYRGFTRGEEPSLIKPNTAYEYEIDLWSTSNLFKRGHRIRLDITSSNFPRWDRNPNTGHDFGTDAELAVAHQAILHDEAHPSHVVLPIVPTVS
ncbi:CocE/NonD family hydrolase [Ktedonobacter robiniae]|uniref:X-Pro dipeptidyl-peptidase n=1 Tax=Ktedonobacter robiniae TaxID=2778365 RepID=A0ABQ3UTG3_9CHLR|nr:CocE/NonD family hydrolase [Ktedonobacter robiniae]GHO55935.1 X-Pro dipeptidyl-peptidase [Ktedonobacter robiniae]